MKTTMITMTCPLGTLHLVARADELAAVHLPGDEVIGSDEVRATGVLAETRRQLAAYFAGTLRVFELPLAPEGTGFQARVWRALERIPYGETRSYGHVAREIGRPAASRAVGAANGRNPIAIIVPCHRVIGANGDLTGYGGGMAAKKWLLDHERRHAGVQPQLALGG